MMKTSDIIDLFFSFQGRIRRRIFWMAFVILICIHIGVGYQIDPNYYDLESEEIVPPTLGGLLWSLAICIPEFAITVKRLNDRDWPWWTGYALLGLTVTLFVGEYLGLFVDQLFQLSIYSIYYWTVIALSLIVLIDNGFVRGTRGQNRYGPDPHDSL